MPRQYLKCDKNGCDGEIKIFAETQVHFGTMAGDSGESTEFWQCGICLTIYQRDRQISGDYIHCPPDGFSNFSEFKGKATREELDELAPDCSGHYYDDRDNKIVASRTEKIRILKELREKLETLNGYPGIKIKKTIAFSCKPIGNEGLFVFETPGEEMRYAWGDVNIHPGEEIVIVSGEFPFEGKSRKCCFVINTAQNYI